MGLNVRPRELPGLSTGYACLRELDLGANAPSAWLRLAGPLLRALRRFEREGFEPFRAGFHRRDLLRDLPVTTTLPGLPEGRARGVAADGALQVEDAAGRVWHVASGEVSIRPAGPGREAA